MNMWAAKGKSIDELTESEIQKEIELRNRHLEILWIESQYADHGAYGQDLNNISFYREEIRKLAQRLSCNTL